MQELRRSSRRGGDYRPQRHRRLPGGHRERLHEAFLSPGIEDGSERAAVGTTEGNPPGQDVEASDGDDGEVEGHGEGDRRGHPDPQSGEHPGADVDADVGDLAPCPPGEREHGVEGGQNGLRVTPQAGRVETGNETVGVGECHRNRDGRCVDRRDQHPGPSIPAEIDRIRSVH